jgi:hypothetical protein
VVYTLCVTTSCPPEKSGYLLEKVCDLVDDYGFHVIAAEGTPKGDEVFDATPSGELIEYGHDEICPNCSAVLVWATSSYHCKRCGFHAGCCEGEPQS